MKKLSERVLILLNSSVDHESFIQALSNSMETFGSTSASKILSEIDKGVGVLLVSKEAISYDAVIKLSGALNAQPTWSNIPVVVLLNEQDFAKRNDSTFKLLKTLRNLTFLERPVPMSTVKSVVQAALAERKRQFEVHDLLNTLEISKKEATDANQAKSNFLANMSHEIRTPLAAILGYSELLVEPNITDIERQYYIDSVRRNGNLMVSLVDNILDLSKVESGKFEVESVEVSIKEMISEIISELEPAAASKKLRLMINYDSFRSDLIVTDVIRLKQILMNIVGNAIKFTLNGTIHLKVGTEPLVANENKMHLNIEVTDSGIGISDEQAKTLFRPFTQADNSITRKFGGTGLGLVLSKKLAQAMGGDLILKRSEPSKGSTFKITTVVGRPSHDQVTKFNTMKDVTPDKFHSLPLYKLKILIVDDSQDNQFLISHLLKMYGADVETADDGVMAIEKATRENYEIVLMDIQMPKLGGLEATTELRRQRYFKPIVALTANALKGDRERCFSAGCDGYLTKPIQRNELIQTICDVSRRPFN
ncbi:MAG: response regulator [Bdellovibrio sp.]|nr:response regulator [Bdellovibrio sp.]